MTMPFNLNANPGVPKPPKPKPPVAPGAPVPVAAPTPSTAVTPAPAGSVQPITAANVPSYAPVPAAGGATTGQGMIPVPGGVQPITAANVPSYAPGPAPSVPNTTAPVTPYGPGHDLIGSQINPTVDPRLAGTQGAVDAARLGLTGGPDRTQLAQNAFNDFLTNSQSAFDRNARQITQRAAAGGRTGSGMYGSDLVDLGTAANRDRLQEANRLASGLADSTRNDQFNTLSALSGLEGQQYGQGLGSRNELRGERGFQVGQRDQATQDAVNQRLLEEQLLNGQFGRDQQITNDLINVGYGGNPAGTILSASGDAQAGANGSNQALNDLLMQYFQRLGTPQTAGG